MEQRMYRRKKASTIELSLRFFPDFFPLLHPPFGLPLLYRKKINRLMAHLSQSDSERVSRAARLSLRSCRNMEGKASIKLLLVQ
jgi:hypothetical protein